MSLEEFLSDFGLFDKIKVVETRISRKGNQILSISITRDYGYSEFGGQARYWAYEVVVSGTKEILHSRLIDDEVWGY